MEERVEREDEEAPHQGCRGNAGNAKRERGLSKVLSVLRASTKVQQQRRGSSGQARFVDDEDVDEDSSISLEERRRGVCPASLTREAGRQRGAAVAPSAEAEKCRKHVARGEWSQAEEAVLAHKHMELGNKWTTISHFLPARSDNDVKNIWHSTLRSKNSERRSFLRTYARAVRDCANDTEARKQAYEMAHHVCGPPQAIDVALATVQEQFQQQVLLQGSQPDEVLESARSLEDQPGQDGDAELGAIQTDAQDPSPLLQLQPLQDQLLESRRSGASSRTTSAALDSQQHSGSGTRGLGSPAQSPQLTKNLRGTSARTPSPSPNPLEVSGAAAAAAGSHAYQLLSDGRACSRSQSHQQAHVNVADEASLARSSRASDFDSSCIARLSGLQLADRLHRQQQLYHHQLQHPQHLGSPVDLLASGARNSFSSGPQGRAQQPSHAMISLAYCSVGGGSASAHGGSASAAGMARLVAQGPGPGTGGVGAPGCPADIDDLVALGLDLTPEELRLLAQGDTGLPVGGRLGESAQSSIAAATAQKALGLARTLQPQQHHQFVVSARATSGGTNSSMLHSHFHPQQQSGYSSLELPSSPLLHVNHTSGLQSGPSAGATLEQQQPNPLDSLLCELEQDRPSQLSLQQQHPSLGAGYPGILSSLGAGSYDRGGYPTMHNPRMAQHGPVSCSSAFDLLSSGQQHLRPPGPSGLGTFVASHGGFSHMNGGVASLLAHGSSQYYPPHGGDPLSGTRPWGPGLVRAGGSNGNTRTLSSPAPFCCDATQLQQHGALGGISGGGLGFAPPPIVSGGQIRLGSVVAQHMGSLAEPPTVDVVTMGLDSGNLLDCMDCEGQPVEPGVNGEAAERVALPHPFELTLQAPLLTSQPQPQLDLHMPRFLGGTPCGGLVQQQGSPACWPPNMPPASTGRIGPMLRL